MKKILLTAGFLSFAITANAAYYSVSGTLDSYVLTLPAAGSFNGGFDPVVTQLAPSYASIVFNNNNSVYVDMQLAPEYHSVQVGGVTKIYPQMNQKIQTNGGLPIFDQGTHSLTGTATPYTYGLHNAVCLGASAICGPLFQEDKGWSLGTSQTGFDFIFSNDLSTFSGTVTISSFLGSNGGLLTRTYSVSGTTTLAPVPLPVSGLLFSAALGVLGGHKLRLS